MQLTLSLLESPAPLAHLWEGLPEEDRETALRILARLMARMAGLEVTPAIASSRMSLARLPSASILRPMSSSQML